MARGIRPHNLTAQATWDSPGARYDAISRTIADAIEHGVERLDPRPGARVLDLATGTGWASRVVAARFSRVDVTGADIAEEMLAHARAVASASNLPIRYVVGDAEALPFEDGAFDAVVSTFGVMFASRPEDAADEIARVLRPGGRLVLTTWRPDGNVARMFGVMRPYMAPKPGSPPSPFEWGREERVAELLGDRFDLAFEEGENRFRYASGAQAWDLWVEHYGPMKALAASLDAARREDLRRDLVAWHETFASPLGFEQPRRYLVTRGIRR